VPKSAFTQGWQRQLAKRNAKTPDPPPTPPRCDYPDCNEWGSFGYRIAGIEGLGKPTFFNLCRKHRLRNDEDEA
jgi:hypothetical protein